MPTEKANAEKEPQSPVEELNGLEAMESRQSMASNAAFRTRRENDKKQKQLADYTAWVNNYLKRKPGVPLITDIRVNLKDGISFINLVEIVSRAEVEGVDRYPTSAEARHSNLQQAVDFLRMDGVNIQREAVRDILEGNSKGIMRVVLGIAERYQPRSVKPRSASDPKPYSVVKQQLSHVTSNRYTFNGHMTDHVTPKLSTNTGHPGHSITDHVRRTLSPDEVQKTSRKSNLAANSFSVPNISSFSVHPHTNHTNHTGHNSHSTHAHGVNQSLSQNSVPVGFAHPRELGSLSQPSHPFQLTPTAEASTADQEKDVYSTPIDHLPPSASTRLIAPIRKKGVQLKLRSPGPSAIQSIPEDRELMDDSQARRASVEAMLMGVANSRVTFDPGMEKEIGEVLSGLNSFKTELLQLHAVLLKNGDSSETNLLRAMDGSKEGVVNGQGNEKSPEVNGTAMLAEKQHLLTAKEAEILSLRDQFSQLQDEYTQLSAECTTLRTMVDERDTFIKTMKTEIYRKEYKNDTAKVDLHHQLLQKDAIIKKMESELTTYQHSLETQHDSIEEANHQLEQHKTTEIELKVEIDSLKMELARVSTNEESLHSKLASRDRKLVHLEEKLGELVESRSRRNDTISEDADSIREVIVTLRRNLSPQDPQQLVIDALEQTIAELLSKIMDRTNSPTGKLVGSPTGKRSKRHSHRTDADDHHKDRDRDRDRERRRRHKERHSERQEAAPTSSSNVTKVIYYIVTDKKETPYATTVYKRSDEVTLRDFKAVFDRPGSFRYFVKTEDPDCGVVKEEVKRDDTTLPSWKGRILVWVSEKTHHR